MTSAAAPNYTGEQCACNGLHQSCMAVPVILDCGIIDCAGCCHFVLLITVTSCHTVGWSRALYEVLTPPRLGKSTRLQILCWCAGEGETGPSGICWQTSIEAPKLDAAPLHMISAATYDASMLYACG